jgi:hypothetical protein
MRDYFFMCAECQVKKSRDGWLGVVVYFLRIKE